MKSGYYILVSMIHTTRNLLFMAVLASSVLSLAGATDSRAASPVEAKLIGTIISKAFTGAVLIDAKGEQIFYRLYEKLPDGMQIVKVHSDRISLKGESGEIYDVYISHEVVKGGSAIQSAQIGNSPQETAKSQVEPAVSKYRREIRKRSSSSEKD